MMSLKNLLLLGAASMASLIVQGPMAASQGRPASQKLQHDLLVSNASKFLAATAKIKLGETVLLVSDRSTDEVARAAVFEAAKKAGGNVTQLVLDSPDVTDGLEIARQMRFKTWYPTWIWKAAAETDVMLLLTHLSGGHTRPTVPQIPRLRTIEVPFMTREALADPRARGNYPEEIVVAIAKVLWQQIKGGRAIQLTDREGTSLKWTLDARSWEGLGDFNPERSPTHISMPPPFRSQPPDMQGWLVGSATHSGPLPSLRMRVEGGRVVEVQGGGHVRDYLLKKFEESKDLQFPGFPAPGSNWVEETALGTHPGMKRIPGAERLGWWSEMHAWEGAPMAGVFHIAVGTSDGSRTYLFVKEHNIEIQHLDIELYAPTLTIDGRKIITNAHLHALDDPTVRQVAAKYGNPDDLLKVTPMGAAHQPSR